MGKIARWVPPLVFGTEGWAPPLGTGLGVLAFAVSDLADRLNYSRLRDFTVYTASFEKSPMHLPGYDPHAWPDLTAAALSCGLLVWAVVRRDPVVAVTALVFGGQAWVTSTPTSEPGMRFLSSDQYSAIDGWSIPAELAPACVLLSGAVLAYLLRERGAGPLGSPEGPAPLPGF